MKTINRFKDSKAVEVARTMPAGLSHWPDKNKPFDIRNSEIVAWLINQEEVQKYIWEKFRHSGAIEFNSETQTWAGNPDAQGSSEGSRFQTQYSASQILDVIKKEPLPVSSEIVKAACREKLKMSHATFYRLWKQLKEEGKIIKPGEYCSVWVAAPSIKKLIPKVNQSTVIDSAHCP